MSTGSRTAHLLSTPRPTAPRTCWSISPWTRHRGGAPGEHRWTFAPDELAGRKAIAFFDRAAARDFVDVYALSRRFTETHLLELARDVDGGFDLPVFIDMLRHSARYSDVDLALGEVDIAALRGFFQQWITELDSSER